MTAPEAFEKWWQALPLRNGEITADHIRQAWDAGVMFMENSADKQEDAAYRNGYMQAWREWSACVGGRGVSVGDLERMERRRARMENYGC